MQRHESITDAFVAELVKQHRLAVARVRAAVPNSKRQMLLILATYPYRTALLQVEEGWSEDEIIFELTRGRVARPMLQPGKGEIICPASEMK